MNLTGGAGNDTFNVGAWTGKGTLTGGGAVNRLVATRNSDMTLTNASLSSPSPGFGKLTLSGMTIAELAGGLADNVIFVDGWTGTGSINEQNKLNATTVKTETPAAPVNAPAVVDILNGNADVDWFFLSVGDVLDAIEGETKTAI